MAQILEHVQKAIESHGSGRLRVGYCRYKQNKRDPERIVKSTVVPICGIAFMRWRELQKDGGRVWYRYLERHPLRGIAPFLPPKQQVSEERWVIFEMTRVTERKLKFIDLVDESGGPVDPNDYPLDALMHMIQQRHDLSTDELESNVELNDQLPRALARIEMEEQAADPLAEVSNQIAKYHGFGRERSRPSAPPAEGVDRGGYFFVDRMSRYRGSDGGASAE